MPVVHYREVRLNNTLSMQAIQNDLSPSYLFIGNYLPNESRGVSESLRRVWTTSSISNGMGGGGELQLTPTGKIIFGFLFQVKSVF